MKKTTQEERLNALLGLTETVAKVKSRATGLVVGVPEEEIQEFREIQGLIYFLQAPQLFTPRTCKNCEAPFMVSRRNVAFCCYECIKASLRKIGIEWSKGQNLERLAEDPEVYNGNEPLWIRHDTLLKAQEVLTNLLANSPKPDTKSDSPTPDTSNKDSSLTIPLQEKPLPSYSPPSTTTPLGTSTRGKTSSSKKSAKRVFTFKD